MKFTFKTEKSTGRYGPFYNDQHYVKLNKKKCGQIYSDNDGRGNSWFKITLMVMKTETITDDNPNCPWKAITLKYIGRSLSETKLWLNNNFDIITSKYKIYQGD